MSASINQAVPNAITVLLLVSRRILGEMAPPDGAHGDLAQFSRGVDITELPGISREKLIRKKLLLKRLNSKSVIPIMKGAFGEEHDEANRE